MELYAVETCVDESSSRCREGHLDIIDLSSGELAREPAIPGAPEGTRCHRLESAIVLGVGLTATVDDLAHQLTSMSVDRMRHLRQAGNRLVRFDSNLSYGLLADDLDVEVARDDETDAAFREVLVNRDELGCDSAAFVGQPFPSS
jgi:hypothetical protein